jgi:DNA-binding beta-propeller fold protein YncE
VTTFAGSVQGSKDGQGTSASFSGPSGIAIDSSGNFYIADYGNHRIRKINSTKYVTTIAGSTKGTVNGQGTTAQFSGPASVAVDANMNFYVTDYDSNRIRKINSTLYVSTIAGNTAGFANGQGTSALLSLPDAIVVDATGNIFFGDGGNNRQRKINTTLYVSTIAGGAPGFANGQGTSALFSGPCGTAIDSSGNLYISDNGNNRIRKINSTGFVTTIAGNTQGTNNGQGTSASFNGPYGIAIDTSGNLYVADYNSHRIRKINSTGYVSTIAGNTAGFADGQGTSALFNYPSGLAIDSSGNLYVADSSNNRVRKILKASLA